MDIRTNEDVPWSALWLSVIAGFVQHIYTAKHAKVQPAGLGQKLSFMNDVLL